jgi:choline dehydrogenase-like flavoprotein
MILDFRELENHAVIEADLCIIGAGAAGITVAHEFLNSKRHVVVIESGGFELDRDTQSLYRGKNVGLKYYPLEACRLRFFGGTTGHWNGQCSPLNEMDFQERPWVPFSGWPITKADLDPFYKRAHSIIGLGPYAYDDDVWRMLKLQAPRLDPMRLEARFWQFSRRLRFGQVYRQDLQNAQDVHVYLHANLLSIETNRESSVVDQIEIRSLEGKAGTVKAKTFVLATGAIENARLLLLSNHVEPMGVGNRFGLVGRFFMEHPEIDCGTVLPINPVSFLESYRRHWLEDLIYLPGLRLSPKRQKEEETLNCGAMIMYDTDPDSGVKALIDVASSLKKTGKLPDQLWTKLWNVLTDLDDVVVGAYSYFVEKKEPLGKPRLVSILGITEQAPNPQSRVYLSDEKDPFGLNRPALDWRLTELDKRGLSLLPRLLGLELGRLNLGRVRLADWLQSSGFEAAKGLGGGPHHMGTTRMSDDPKKGVVDRNCRVHGNANLYIAGGSVFPTSGYNMPTLTIVALALRLADHLKTRLV